MIWQTLLKTGMVFKQFSDLAQRKLSNYTAAPSNCSYWKACTKLVRTLVLHYSFHLGIQTSSLNAIFSAFSLLYLLDIYWNFWEVKCPGNHEFMNTAQVTKNRVPWRKAKPEFARAAVICTGNKKQCICFLFGIWNWFIVLTSLRIWKKIKINLVNVRC